MPGATATGQFWDFLREYQLAVATGQTCAPDHEEPPPKVTKVHPKPATISAGDKKSPPHQHSILNPHSRNLGRKKASGLPFQQRVIWLRQFGNF